MSEFRNEFTIEASRRYALFSIVLHAGAACMAILASAPSTLTAAIICLLLIALIVDWRSNRQVIGCRIIRHRQLSWRIVAQSGRDFGPANVISGRVMPWISWLRLRDAQGHHQTLCVPADTMSATQYRRFRMLANESLGL